MRSEGMSLGKISGLIGISKSTLFGWNTRYRDKIDELKRIQMEALEERILGSYQHQFTTLSRMLKRLEKTLARKLRDFEDDLSLTEVFWMTSNLRHQVHRFRTYSAATDVPAPRPAAEQIRTIPHENEPPSLE
jgi:hypothetical protein